MSKPRNKFLYTICIAFVLGSIAVVGCTKRSGTSTTKVVADTVYMNGKIYTVNESEPWVEAVAIKDGKFIAIGSNAEVEAVTSTETVVIDMAGAFAMPGLVDVHTHPSMSMLYRVYCELPGTFYQPTEEMTIEALKKCIEVYPEDEKWFIAEGYSSPVMSDKTLTTEFLDTLISDRPAYIKDESGHYGWANTKAFKLLGIDKNTPDTPDGYYSRKPNGEPAGQIFEAAMNPFEDAIMPLSPETSRLAKTKLLDQASEKGITATGDAYVFEHDLVDWQALHQSGELDQHIVLFMKGNLGTDELTPVTEVLRYYEDYDLPGHPGVKVSMGGAIESATEVMVDGYKDNKEVQPIISIAKFTKYVQELDDAGIQLKVHAIGDGTVRATLDSYEPVIKARGTNGLRHHIDHCSYIHPDDMPRFQELGVGCTAWPMLGAPIGYINNQAKYLKEETFSNAFPNRDMLDAGVMLSNHSDAPQANLWPWWGMEATITRGFPGHPELGKLGPHQAITLEETLKVHTINGAWILRLDDQTGSIEEGKWADMIVLNHNLFDIPATDIHKTEVKRTVFKGNVVYEGQ